jgi:hypothetical protein
MDWREWRADEFMGAFLVPPAAMRKALLPRASEAGIRFRWRIKGGAPMPVLACGPDGLELMADELAQVFGVSPTFIGVRLRKYGFAK